MQLWPRRPTRTRTENNLVMALEYICPQCGHVYRKLSNRLAGKKVQCKCGHRGRLAQSGAPPVQTPPALPESNRGPTDRPANEANAPSTGDAVAERRVVVQDDFSDLDDLLGDG